eukprot:1154426-Pelagomonas_calceolata.AAC.2
MSSPGRNTPSFRRMTSCAMKAFSQPSNRGTCTCVRQRTPRNHNQQSCACLGPKLGSIQRQALNSPDLETDQTIPKEGTRMRT